MNKLLKRTFILVITSVIFSNTFAEVNTKKKQDLFSKKVIATIAIFAGAATLGGVGAYAYKQYKANDQVENKTQVINPSEYSPVHSDKKDTVQQDEVTVQQNKANDQVENKTQVINPNEYNTVLNIKKETVQQDQVTVAEKSRFAAMVGYVKSHKVALAGITGMTAMTAMTAIIYSNAPLLNEYYQDCYVKLYDYLMPLGTP